MIYCIEFERKWGIHLYLNKNKWHGTMAQNDSTVVDLLSIFKYSKVFTRADNRILRFSYLLF